MKQAGGDKVLVEQFRDAAANAMTGYEGAELIGLEGRRVHLAPYSDAGATPEQVIDSLVLGLYFYESNGRCYSQSFPLRTPTIQSSVLATEQSGEVCVGR